jgi:hypothetical protein
MLLFTDSKIPTMIIIIKIQVTNFLILEIKAIFRKILLIINTRTLRFYFADPHYHEDSHEPLMCTPHGYLTNDDVN